MKGIPASLWGTKRAAMNTAESPVLHVTFKSRNKSGREWKAEFRMGSDDANTAKAVQVAWTHNAEITNPEQP